MRNLWLQNGLQATLVVGGLCSTALLAGPREQCYQMHNRLVGVPPTEAVLTSCITQVEAGSAQAAAAAMLEHDFFYTDTLRYFVAPWTNEASDYHVDLNDFSATLIGMVRDDIDWRQALYGDIQYTCEGAADIQAAFANESNDHYAECGNRRDLKNVLLQKTQTELNPALAGQPGIVPAGLYTTRQWASEYYNAGTNRAALRNTLYLFMCEDIEAFHDLNVSDTRVRQDVDRQPGGSSKTWINECKGCHSGMDPLAGAFAYLDWDDDNGVLTNSRPAGTPTPQDLAGAVIPKYSVNAGTYPDGYQTVDDSWMNLWTIGQNARVGWGVPDGQIMRGNGPQSFGQMFANTDQFARCAAKQVYRRVCLTDTPVDSATAKTLATHFKTNGYKMKSLFAKTATMCMGE